MTFTPPAVFLRQPDNAQQAHSIASNHSARAYRLYSDAMAISYRKLCRQTTEKSSLSYYYATNVRGVARFCDSVGRQTFTKLNDPPSCSMIRATFLPDFAPAGCMMDKIGIESLSEPVLDHIHKDVITLRVDQTSAEAAAEFRRKNIGGRIVYLYVVDHERKLLGVVPVRRLLGSDPSVRIEDLMVAPAVSVKSSATVLDACELLLEHRFLAMPAVDDEGRLEGIIDLNQFTDDVLTGAHQRMDSAFQLIGVHVALGRRVSSWRSFRDRFPWLGCNMASGIVCAFIASRFELLLSEVVLLAMFLTVVLALGESVSMQSMTITLQSLIGRQTSWRQILISARKEFATSGMLGFGCGAIIGGTAWAWRGAPMQALAVGGSICLSIIAACMLGVAIPTAIHKLKIDPKVAAGPIVLASADVATLLYYFSVAEWLLR